MSHYSDASVNRRNLIGAASATLLASSNAAASELAGAAKAQGCYCISVKSFGAVGDGLTDDSEAFTKALNACRSINNNGRRASLHLDGSVYKITFNPSMGLEPKNIYSQLNFKSFYTIDSSWTQRGAWDTDKPYIHINGNNSVIIADGPANSWLLASTTQCQIEIDDLEIESSGRSNISNGVFSYFNLHATWNNVTFKSFTRGIAMNVALSERNTYIGCDFINCGTGVRLGVPVAGSRERYQANENRFIGCNFMYCGADWTDVETDTRGFLEIIYSENPVFVGGSWKSNDAPVIIANCSNGLFEGIYFEQISTVRTLPAYARRYVVLNSIWGGDLFENSFSAPIKYITFKNCYIGSYGNIGLKAGPLNGYQYHIETIVFDNCFFGTNSGFIYELAHDEYIHRIKVNGNAWGEQQKLKSGSLYLSPRTVAPPQYLGTYPIGRLGLASFNVLDIELEYPNYSVNRYPTATTKVFDRPVSAAGLISGGGSDASGTFAKTFAGLYLKGNVGPGIQNSPKRSGLTVPVVSQGPFIKFGDDTDEQGFSIQAAKFGIQHVLRIIDGTTEVFRVSNVAEFAPGVGLPETLTNATYGFMHVRTINGPPTGIPQLYLGLTPMVVDRAGSKLWIYIAGVWKSTSLT